jgi:hypothetical protein
MRRPNRVSGTSKRIIYQQSVFNYLEERLAVRLITKCLQTHDTLAEDEAVAAVKPPHLVLIDIRESASARVPIFPL